jgi:hypothetical protein
VPVSAVGPVGVEPSEASVPAESIEYRETEFAPELATKRYAPFGDTAAALGDRPVPIC